MVINYVYYPSTAHHLLVSIILRDTNKHMTHSIILDENYFSQKIIQNINYKKTWVKSLVIKSKNSKIHNYLSRNVFYKIANPEIFELSSTNLVTFTFGNRLSNILINSLHKNNTISLCEDGIFPYYGTDVVKTYYGTVSAEKWQVTLKRLFNVIVSQSKSKLIIEMINKYILFYPEWLSAEYLDKYKIEQTFFDEKILTDALQELSIIYSYKKVNLPFNIDVVYFDSGNYYLGDNIDVERSQSIMRLFSSINNKNIYVKLRPDRGSEYIKERISYYKSMEKHGTNAIVVSGEETEYPWEVIYYNNMDVFKDTVYISDAISTAQIFSNKFFHYKNDIICLNYLLNFNNRNKGKTIELINPEVKLLIDRINACQPEKIIHLVEAYSEISYIIEDKKEEIYEK